jgi:hypothetical protein
MGSATPVYLTGPAQTVFSGEITLPALDNFPVETNPPSAEVPRIR